MKGGPWLGNIRLNLGGIFSPGIKLWAYERIERTQFVPKFERQNVIRLQHEFELIAACLSVNELHAWDKKEEHYKKTPKCVIHQTSFIIVHFHLISCR